MEALVEGFERLCEALALTALGTLGALGIFADYDVGNNLVGQMSKQQIGTQESIQGVGQVNKFSPLGVGQAF